MINKTVAIKIKSVDNKDSRSFTFGRILFIAGILILSNSGILAQTWFDSNWQYRREVTIQNTSASTLSEFQTKIALNSSNFDFSKLLPDGADLIVTDSDGQSLLPFWLETWTNNFAEIWISLPLLTNNSSKVIYLYYGNESAQSASNGKNTFPFFDGFESFAPKASNSPTSLSTPTYDGSGQAVHPDIVYVPAGWNGYKYWMAITPFKNNDDAYENPSIIVSNDGLTWINPPGIINPIVPQPPAGYNNDNDLLLVNNSLVLYFNETNNDGNTYVKRMTSANGINWTSPQSVFSFPWHLMSPTVIFENNLYSMWYVRSDGCYTNSSNVYLRVSSDGINWGPEQNVNMALEGKVIWHFDVIKNDNGYEMLVVIYPNTSSTCSRTSLYFARSLNKIDWQVNPIPVSTPALIGWDDYNIYRSTFIAADSFYKIWYSSRSSNLTWNIGYFEGRLDDFYKNWNNAKGNFSLNSNIRRSGQYGLQSSTSTTIEYLKKNISGQLNLNTWFYDTGNSSSGSSIIMKVFDYLGSSIGAGINTSFSSGKYVYVTKDLVSHFTQINRTAGWHKFSINIRDNDCIFLIDNQSIATLADLDEKNINRFLLTEQGNQQAFFDDIYFRKYLPQEPVITVAAADTKYGEIQIQNGWNIVSIPLLHNSMQKSAIFPGAISSAYGYQNGYVAVTTFQNGKGYWIKYATDLLLEINGQPVIGPVSVNQGWNMIGPFDKEVEVNRILYNPPGIKLSNYWGYNRGYFAADILKPGMGYWIKVSSNGTLDFTGALNKSFHTTDIYCRKQIRSNYS